MRFRFYNFELGYSNGSTLLQGWSNRVYGKPSRWSDAHQAQCVEVEVKDENGYLAMAVDLKLAWHLPMRLWVPVPEFANPLTGPVADFQAGYELGMDRRPLPDEASANTIAGYLAAPEESEQINGAEQPDVKVIPTEEPKTQLPPYIQIAPGGPGEPSEPMEGGGSITVALPLYAMKFFALRKIAKTEGVDISACAGVPQIVAAIEEHRKQQPA